MDNLFINWYQQTSNQGSDCSCEVTAYSHSHPLHSWPGGGGWGVRLVSGLTATKTPPPFFDGVVFDTELLNNNRNCALWCIILLLLTEAYHLQKQGFVLGAQKSSYHFDIYCPRIDKTSSVKLLWKLRLNNRLWQLFQC